MAIDVDSMIKNIKNDLSQVQPEDHISELNLREATRLIEELDRELEGEIK